MSISDTDFRTWLDNERSLHCILFEADYRDTITNLIATEYLATMPFVSGPTDTPANQTYKSLITAIPEFSQTMSDLLIGRTVANPGKIEAKGGSAVTDAWVFGRDWLGRGLRLYVGDPSWARSDFRSMWTGVCSNFALSGTSGIVFEARDMQHLLNQPIRTPAMDIGAFAGRPTPLVFGQAFNIPAVLLDATTHKYMVNDGPVAAISIVRIAGISVAFTPSLSDGTFTHATANPNGVVTADVTAATVGTNPLNNASDLIRHIVTTRGYFQDSDLDASSFATLKLQCPAALAYFVPPSKVSVFEAIDQIVNTVGAFASMTRDGKFFVKRFDFTGAPVISISESDMIDRGLTLVRVLQPVSSIRIGSKTNYTITPPVQGGFGGATETDIAQHTVRHRDASHVGNPNASLYAKMRSLVIPPDGQPQTQEAPDPGTIPSLFVNQADAAAEASRRMGIWGVPRYVFRFNCFVPALRLNIGDAITITHPRYQFSTGKTGVIVGIKERLSQKRVQLDVII